MKKIIAIVLVIALAASLLTGCNGDTAEPTGTHSATDPTPAPTEPPSSDVTDPPATEDPLDQYSCITVAEAIAICQQTGETETTDKYYIRGTITSVSNETYGNMYIEDETGSIMIYGTYSGDGALRYDAMETKPVAGDDVVLFGVLLNYKNNTPEMKNAWIVGHVANPVPPSTDTELPAEGSTLTVAEALALPLSSGDSTPGRYYITGIVESVTNAAYGTMTITDETGTISVYGSYSADGTTGYADLKEKPYKGDTVTLYCVIQNYNGTIEVYSGWIISFTSPEVSYDPNEYTEMTLDQARDAAEGTKIKTTGVVAQLVYGGSADAPCGFILVDSTGSIYVYDGDLAARVALGNTVTIAAAKTYWIQSKEQSAADKWGYKGCCQLADVTLIELNETVTDFDTSWIRETTVQQIMDTPVSEDISTLIFQVNALIKRDASYGDWVNYFIDDLDGVTGSYCYTQCDGDDYAWLDAYDGKICTMYVVALNAKCESAGCTWRFLPIAVINDNFDTSTVNGAEYAVKYVGIKQFQTSYTGDPELALEASVSNDLLGLSGVKLSYSSSDASVISVEDNVLHCLKSGTATITVSASHNGKNYSEDVTITVDIPQEGTTYSTVSDAIGAAVGDTVTVKGIVGPSLVNKTGFYLIDSTGLIAVITDDDTMASLQVGQEIVMEGLRDRFYDSSKNGGTHAGQTCITGAKVITNNYGVHDYDTSNFVTDKTITDLYNLDASVDYSTTVFVVTATVTKGSGQWATYGLSDGTSTLTLYSGSTAQYGWLEQFLDQEVTIEVAACNWNNKSYWRGCVLAVILPDGSKVVNTLNFS